eukprot:CAMPEP_0169313356 /NCGR_PEP_ID=MMETSP1017-20121227/4537_1 /TAXON_ID=342587 /ORGANISM="Karlodinium micrum, Strain CCMP2283" /LENGTH=119 /DNA_ID=CAMNT_0009407215 /DNA_START=37 /DNA_END=396 /DNA_ORIENTATION=-
MMLRCLSNAAYGKSQRGKSSVFTRSLGQRAHILSMPAYKYAQPAAPMPAVQYLPAPIPSSTITYQYLQPQVQYIKFVPDGVTTAEALPEPEKPPVPEKPAEKVSKKKKSSKKVAKNCCC